MIVCVGCRSRCRTRVGSGRLQLVEPILGWRRCWLTGMARKEGLSSPWAPSVPSKSDAPPHWAPVPAHSFGKVKANVGYRVRSIDRRGEIAKACNAPRRRNHAAAESLPIISGLPASSRTWAAKVIGGQDHCLGPRRHHTTGANIAAATSPTRCNFISPPPDMRRPKEAERTIENVPAQSPIADANIEYAEKTA